jgi:hypothetical protein
MKCKKCSREVEDTNALTCRTCRQAKAASMRRRRERRRSSQQCRDCGTPSAAFRCEVCSDKHKVFQKKQNARRPKKTTWTGLKEFKATCDRCAKSFKYKHQLAGRPRKYCDGCVNRGRAPRLILILDGVCRECQQTFTFETFKDSTPKTFCSKRCRNRAKSRDYQWGLSPEAWREMLASQDHKCKICINPLGEAQERHIDHCHETQQMRGVLCNTCNVGLGMFQDSSDLLRAALAYLESSRS